MRALFDTNILIDYLSGVDAAKTEVDRYERPIISIISWMEVLVGATRSGEEPIVRAFLGQFELADVSRPIAERAIVHRRAPCW